MPVEEDVEEADTGEDELRAAREATPAPLAAVEAAASERLLQEQRDQSKHSSQQSITVVGLNAI